MTNHRIHDSVVEGTEATEDARPSLDTAATTAVAAFVDASLQQFDEYCSGRPPG